MQCAEKQNRYFIKKLFAQLIDSLAAFSSYVLPVDRQLVQRYGNMRLPYSKNLRLPDLHKCTASLRMAFLILSSRTGAGAISTTFWWRRWTEQSRSNKWITLPAWSPIIWTWNFEKKLPDFLFERKISIFTNNGVEHPWKLVLWLALPSERPL